MTNQMWVVAYDVTHDGRRQRVANALSRHGDRVQRSVFIVRVPDGGASTLAEEINHIIDPSTDSVHMVLQCACCEDRIVQLGQAVVPPLADCWVVV